MKIANSKPFWSGKEIEFVSDALKRGQISGDGYYTEKVTQYIKTAFKAANVLMTTSGTHALEMAALLCELQAGDEVILPSYSFPTTASSVMLRGAKPVFAEVKENTLNIDPADIARKITSRTRAVICVHYAGIACDMDSILDIARKNNLYIIEDAAQAVYSKYKGEYLGTWGDYGCYSFHGTKNYTCGEGGALLVNNSRSSIMQRAEALRQKGTNRRQFVQGYVDRYTWVEAGSSYCPSDLLMAVLYAQLAAAGEILKKRRAVYQYYENNLKDYEKNGILRMLQIPRECEPNYHLFCVLFNEEKVRDNVMAELRKRGIEASIHFLPLHSSPMGRRLGYAAEDLKITEKISRCLLRLPLHAGLTETELEYVVTNFKEVVDSVNR